MTQSDESLNPENGKNRQNSEDDSTKSIGDAAPVNYNEHPHKIGQYIIKRVIASGGMGTVYEALQENPRRPVAVKVIKDSFTSENAIQRLEYEAQLLARLRHPGIAQIYETGHFEFKGQDTPFFAMEYIPNAKTIVEYAKEKALDLKGILCLFQQVCDAIHHGHQKGIVHRDLKPSNILVDSSGRIRIIDFGVAKATDSDMRQAISHTKVGQIVGSVEYMSPEQFDADPHDIDTRSDIYALGLILYELLAGTLPYKTKSNKIFEYACEVREGKLKKLKEVNPQVDSEVEAIVHKALNKDRDKRYQSAYGLEADIKRYLNGDAISAETLRFAYQFKVFSRKNKLVVGLVAAVFVLLVSGIVLTTNLYITVDKERQRAEEATAQVEKGKRFLTDLLATSATECFGVDFTGEQLLDSASIKVARTFPDDKMIEMELRRSISKAYVGLGKFRKAIKECELAYNIIRDSLDVSNDTMMQVFNDLSFAYNITGRFENKLAIEREYFEKVLETFGENHPETYASKFHLVGDLRENGYIQEANQLAEEAWNGFMSEYGENDVNTLNSQFRYASTLLLNGDIEKGSELIHDAYEKVNKQFGQQHGMYNVARRSLARLYIVESKIDSAKALYGYRKVPNQFDFNRIFQGEDTYAKNPFQLLVYFEEWCPYSKNALTNFGKVDKHYRDFGLDVIGVTKCTQTTKPEDIPAFLKRLDIDFTVYQDSTGECGKFFDITGFPSMRLIADGFVILEQGGQSSNIVTPQMLDGIMTAMKSSPFREGNLEIH